MNNKVFSSESIKLDYIIQMCGKKLFWIMLNDKN